MDEKTRRLKKAQVIELLPKKNYHIGKVMKAVGVSRKTFYTWKENDLDFAESCEDAFEFDIDDSEEKLKLLRSGVPKFDDGGKFVGWTEKPHFGALSFHLRSKAKERGYSDSIEINDKRKDKFRDMTDEELFNEVKSMSKSYNEPEWDIDKDGEGETD